MHGPNRATAVLSRLPLLALLLLFGCCRPSAVGCRRQQWLSAARGSLASWLRVFSCLSPRLSPSPSSSRLATGAPPHSQRQTETGGGARGRTKERTSETERARKTAEGGEDGGLKQCPLWRSSTLCACTSAASPPLLREELLKRRRGPKQRECPARLLSLPLSQFFSALLALCPYATALPLTPSLIVQEFQQCWCG